MTHPDPSAKKKCVSSETTSDQIAPEDHVPLKEKLAYSAGNVGGGFQNFADNYLLNPVFVVTLGISPALMSVRGLVERAWDAITDAIMGWVSDNTKTRWGRRKPYIVLGSFLSSILMWALFMFGRDWALPAIIVWMFIFGLLLALAHTIWNIPYQCLLLEITPNSKERTNVAAFRSYVGLLSGLLMGWIWYLSQLPVFGLDKEGNPDVISGARWVVGIFALVAFVLALLPLFAKERTEPAERKKNEEPLSLRQNLKLTFNSRPFIILIVFTLLMAVGSSIHQSVEFYARLLYVCQGDTVLASKILGFSSISNAISGFLGITVFRWLANRYSKKGSLMTLMFLLTSSGLSTLIFHTPAYPYLALVPSLIAVMANAGLWMLIPSMTGDVVDYDEIKSHHRREGSFASTFSWFLKFSLTLGGAIAGPLMIWLGYQTDLKTEQPAEVVFNIRMLLAFGPTLFYVGSIFALSRYPLGNKEIRDMSETLKARKRAANG